MPLTEAQARALCAKVDEKAAAYFANPSSGHAAGYRPHAIAQQEAPILGMGRDYVEDPTPPGFADWLRGVARIDLSGHSWRVEEFVGQGPGSAEVVIVL